MYWGEGRGPGEGGIRQKGKHSGRGDQAWGMQKNKHV